MRAFLFILDSLGIGGAPDASQYGDEGANTLGHIAQACADGRANKPDLRTGLLELPNFERLGLGLAAQNACGAMPAGFSPVPKLEGVWGNAIETSKGKDTPSGHWEIAGVPVMKDWFYFEDKTPAFPEELTQAIIERNRLTGILGNCHASGTAILEKLGEEHIKSDKPICYTSADSVFQIAAHENHFGLERLYELCENVFELTEKLNLGRVIARPFIGEKRDEFERTGNRRDYSVKPPKPTLLDLANNNGREVIAIGKIADIFSHCGPTKVFKANGNQALGETSLEAIKTAQDGALVITNFVDFDMLYGHRRDVIGYAAALEQFDRMIPQFQNTMREGDLLVLTADHGNDPTWPGTDHTREQVPILCWQKGLEADSIGTRNSFSDIGATIANHLGLDTENDLAGESFYCSLKSEIKNE